MKKEQHRVTHGFRATRVSTGRAVMVTYPGTTEEEKGWAKAVKDVNRYYNKMHNSGYSMGTSYAAQTDAARIKARLQKKGYEVKIVKTTATVGENGEPGVDIWKRKKK